MKIISINVGLPRLAIRNGESVSTGIFKEPVAGRVMLRTLNLDGDRQADLSVHGGPSKAVYVYPSEHYAYWKGELPEKDLPWGMFGENFSTAGLLESEINSTTLNCFVALLAWRPCRRVGEAIFKSNLKS